MKLASTLTKPVSKERRVRRGVRRDRHALDRCRGRLGRSGGRGGRGGGGRGRGRSSGCRLGALFCHQLLHQLLELGDALLELHLLGGLRQCGNRHSEDSGRQRRRDHAAQGRRSLLSCTHLQVPRDENAPMLRRTAAAGYSPLVEGARCSQGRGARLYSVHHAPADHRRGRPSAVSRGAEAALGRLDSGTSFVEADSVASLLAALDAQPDADLLLLDLNMPGAQGFNALAHVRGTRPGLPVVVVSGDDDAQTIAGALRFGAQGSSRNRPRQGRSAWPSNRCWPARSTRRRASIRRGRTRARTRTCASRGAWPNSRRSSSACSACSVLGPAQQADRLRPRTSRRRR